MTLNRIIEGDALTVLKTMPDKLVQCVITSPPYWGLRDYGTAEWEGGDKNCDHIEPQGGQGIASKKQHTNVGSEDIQYRSGCGKCGAIRIDNQLGLEATPEEYVVKMVEIFAEVRRVLRDDGTLWLNLGDSYAGSNRGEDKKYTNPDLSADSLKVKPDWDNINLKPKDLCGIPWRVAFALQADGWYLRSDIIWSKPNPMPESVTDRPTKAHEYLFLMSKKVKYYYDADAIREQGSDNIPWGDSWGGNKQEKLGHNKGGHLGAPALSAGRNRRTVWEIATQPYPEAHFATFPEKLVLPCILAGSNDRACGICGAAWERETEKVNPQTQDGLPGRSGQPHSHNQNVKGEGWYHLPSSTGKTLGFRPTCEHDNGDSRSIILDPFMGSGTVALVALKLGRDYIGIELKQDYIAMAMKRLEPLGNRPLPQQEKILL